MKFTGWLLRGPGEKLYLLYPDGRLFMWQPRLERVVEVARYARIPPGHGRLYMIDPYRGVLIVLTRGGDLVEARSGIDSPKRTTLLVYMPGVPQPISLGNPVRGALYLTALAMGSGNMIYGMTARRVYGLGRTPVHLYSLTRVTEEGK